MSNTFDRAFWKSFGWFLLIAVLICCLPWVLAKHSWIDFSETGQIGDTIGGIMGPFIAIAAAGLTFIAFWVQYKANIQQRHDIAIERFESNLFEMIHIQQEITNGLRYDGNDYNHNEIHKTGRDVFQCFYELIPLRITLDNTSRNLTLYRAFELSDETKNSMRYLKELWGLDHYYRHLYRIFKYIDEQDDALVSENRKYEYAAIVRATLSPYELVMVFYNGFSHPKFKEMIEKYAIFNNLRYKLLASAADRVIYKEKFKESYEYSQDENREMTLEYKKSAFVSQKRISVDARGQVSDMNEG
jgi:hypothetical protein